MLRGKGGTERGESEEREREREKEREKEERERRERERRERERREREKDQNVALPPFSFRRMILTFSPCKLKLLTMSLEFFYRALLSLPATN